MKQVHYILQTLLRGRGSNIIKILSLGLGLTMSILLFSRVAYEQSFDRCYKDYDHLYQIFSVFTIDGETLSPQQQNVGPVAGAILEHFPQEVEAATSLCYWMSSPLYNGSVRFDAPKLVADSLFFRTLGIEVLSGEPEKALAQKDVIFLGERLARRMFGAENPIGKVISYDRSMQLTVQGTYADLPENATVKPEAVISMPTLHSRNRGNFSWSGGDSWYEYIRFRPGANTAVVNERLDALIQTYRPEEDKKQYGYTAFVKPIRDTYRGFEEVKRMRFIMSVLALTILFMAALNYVLIAVSSLAYRAKSVGVHKCSGAGGGTIFAMFLLETAFILLLALGVVGLILLNFREPIEDTVALSLRMLLAPERLWVALLVVAVLFLVGGVLPGRLFAGIPVSQVFRRYSESKRGWKRPLLFVQFAGVAFVGGLMYVVMAQYQYILNKDAGYNPHNIVYGYLRVDSTETCEPIRHFFNSLPYVEASSASSNLLFQGYPGMSVQSEGGQLLFSSRGEAVREDYPALMDMTVKAGRVMRKKDEVMVNETFAERMRWGNEVIGRSVRVEGGTYTVAGQIKNYHTGDYYDEQQPLVLFYTPHFRSYIQFRLKEPFAENLQKMQQAVEHAFPDKTIDLISMEERIANAYNAVRVFRNATVMAVVTLLFIMLMGLIGYTADEVRRRSKEIAIRKVNGAEASSILNLFTRDIWRIAAPAVLLGTLASCYVTGLWMEQFTVQTSVDWTVYAGIALANLVLITGCVLWKSFRIANENPVKSIKNE